MRERGNMEAGEGLAVVAPVRQALRRKAAGVLEQTGALAVGFARVSVAVPPVDPFAWLRAQPGAEKYYWSGRSTDETVAAVGAAHVLTADRADDLGTLREAFAPVLASGLRLYGGIRFDYRRAADAEWQPFGAYRFVVPRFELRVRDGQARLFLNLAFPADAAQPAAVLGTIDRLAEPSALPVPMLPMPASRTDAPGAGRWADAIGEALGRMRTDGLEKVVLARRVDFGFPEPLCPLGLLERLEAATPGCFHFCFQPDTGHAFVGASPERLYRREGRSIWSEAVAGTRARGDSARDDARLRDELLLSEKDRREHAYVRDSIVAALEPLCETLQADTETGEMVLARGRHLYCGVRGRLNTGVADLDVLRALHPTPAVGGFPTPEAVAFIHSVEPFDRGWYAGPVGWIDSDAAEFAVGIRSGLVQPNRLSLFSGAGIVEGSTPEGEWNEIEQKISDFVGVLGLGQRHGA